MAFQVKWDSIHEWVQKLKANEDQTSVGLMKHILSTLHKGSEDATAHDLLNAVIAYQFLTERPVVIK